MKCTSRTLRLAGTVMTLLLALPTSAMQYALLSPGKNIEVTIAADARLALSVSCRGKELLLPSPISLTLGDGTTVGASPVVSDVKRNSVNDVVRPTVRQKSETIVDAYNELRLVLKGQFTLTVRAYDNGVAYRFETGMKGPIRIKAEEVSLHFDTGDTVYFPREESFMSHNERMYEKTCLNQLAPGSFCSLPLLVQSPGGTNVLVTEADLDDYAGLWMKVDDQHALSGLLPAVALKEEAKNDRDIKVSQRAEYIAETTGPRAFPWRVLAIGETDGDLLLNQLVYLLSRTSQLKDESWIRPGKVAWDWWNALNLRGVDFRAGINTDTYKYYIDFASRYGIEYVILDEGWYKLGDLTSVNPEIDMPAIMAHAREKNVGIILWVIWKTLENQLDVALDQFQKWGVKGIKVDFMQRDDQAVVNFYRKIAEEAARRKMLVDFHGSFKPTGLRRTFPNVITREGVRGLEHVKWSDQWIPGHEVTLPFVRMVAGPMDYTPGAMVNAQKGDFKAIFTRPMSMGTRCHQLAMYVVFESPLQMLCDSPTNYLHEQECMEFLAKVPTVWDETRVLQAKVGDYVALARRRANDWYIGAMTDESARELTIDLSFLGSASYQMVAYQDGINADRHAGDFKKVATPVARNQQLTLRLAPGGGWAARIAQQ